MFLNKLKIELPIPPIPGHIPRENHNSNDTRLSVVIVAVLKIAKTWKQLKCPSTHLSMQETQVPSLGQEDPLEKEMATHFSILAWEIPMN